MSKKFINPNARKALEEMKAEIANELGIVHEENVDGGNKTSRNNGHIGGSLGGNMTKRLVEMGENQLINHRNN
ncbi:small, acid-soluble spore protein, alpha/beta type [Dethiothermospora halolimnae]|uniref:small, acid-soluble spore protein, alpha/beta type n=1 Tax=Dethiothermospora halolimnae TaxID=3114390 RepID=UPI003CCBE24C